MAEPVVKLGSIILLSSYDGRLLYGYGLPSSDADERVNGETKQGPAMARPGWPIKNVRTVIHWLLGDFSA